MKNQIEIRKPEIEPTGIENVSGDLEIDSKIESMGFESLDADIKLESRLEQGKLKLGFSFHFDWGVSILEIANVAGLERLKKKLKALNFDDKKITEIVEIIGSEPIDFEIHDTAFVQGSGRASIGGVDMDLSEMGAGKTIDIPLPSFPINVNPKVNMKNFAIKNIAISGKTTLNTNDITLNGSKMGDFSMLIGGTDFVEYEKAELDKARMRPVSIPTLALPEIATVLTIPKLGASEMPINIETKSGGSDVNIPLLDWHPRWRKEICISFFGWRKCIWVEVGFNFKIDLFYKWVLNLLKIAILLRNATITNLTIGVKLANAVINKIKIGLLRAEKIISRIVP